MPERWMWDDRPKGEPTLSWDEGEASGPPAIGTMLMRVSDHEAQVEALQAEVERLRAVVETAIEDATPRESGIGCVIPAVTIEELRAALSPQPEERSK